MKILKLLIPDDDYKRLKRSLFSSCELDDRHIDLVASIIVAIEENKGQKTVRFNDAM